MKSILTEQEKLEKVIKGLGRVSNDIVDGYITEPDTACSTINDAIDLLKALKPCDDAISRSALLVAYDEAHKGPPGGARRLIEEAPSVLSQKSEPRLVGNIKTYSPGRKCGLCPKCNAILDDVFNIHHCGICGQAVKWNERE